MKSMQKTIGFVSLGCDKNRVDLEYMIADFLKAGYKHVSDDVAQVVVINTCAFIEQARDEAIEIIKQVASRKDRNDGLELLVVSGCLPNCEEVFNEIKRELAYDVDVYVRIEEQENIVQIVGERLGLNLNKNPACGERTRMLTTIGSTAFLKICDGCNNFCSYCRIPLIRGRFRSREIDDIANEAEKLVAGGVKELILIGQDVTAYGKDLPKKPTLTMLLKELVKIKDLAWIRLLYCYGENVTPELVELIKKQEKICKYIDIPLQHINDSILRSMNRKTNAQKTKKMLDNLHSQIPQIAVRTTFIVGFPGETRAQFKELVEFVDSSRFAYVGVFAYSQEVGTPAASLPNQIKQRVKNRRKKILEKAAKKANARFLSTLVSKKFMAVCEGKFAQNLFEMRGQFGSPEIDTPIYLTTEKDLIIGEFYEIEIKTCENNLLTATLV